MTASSFSSDQMDIQSVAQALRAFNRSHTQRIGVLEEGLLRSPYSLTQCRVLFELAASEGLTALSLRRGLRLDAGYVTRLLTKFEADGLVTRSPSPSDGRSSRFTLTEAGQTVFGDLDSTSQADAEAMLAPLTAENRLTLAEALKTADRLLDHGQDPEQQTPVKLRPHRPGDLGWVVSAHGRIYTEEFGWDASFEGFVAGIAATFVRDFKPERERCWIAEHRGSPVGSVFLVEGSEGDAKLRMLIVDPAARGLGVGRLLVGTCIEEARGLGYRAVTLWTNDTLLAARHLYQSFGFECVASEPHHSFGVDLVGETWRLSLC